MVIETEKKAFDSIRMIERKGKPRNTGITYARDRGMGLRRLEAILEEAAEYIDILKMSGFYARLQSRELMRRKVELCREAGVEVGMGGALPEIAMLQGPEVLKAFLEEVREMGFTTIEVCRQIVIMPLSHMLEILQMVKEEYGLKPIAEVGVAYGITPDEPVFVDEDKLIGTMRRCLEAGAWKLLLESEGITESRHTQDYRWDVVSKVANSFDLDSIMFEGDDPNVFNRYVKDYGPEVNLFVDHSNVLRLEAVRRGGWGNHPIINRVATFYRTGR